MWLWYRGRDLLSHTHSPFCAILCPINLRTCRVFNVCITNVSSLVPTLSIEPGLDYKSLPIQINRCILRYALATKNYAIFLYFIGYSIQLNKNIHAISTHSLMLLFLMHLKWNVILNAWIWEVMNLSITKDLPKQDYVQNERCVKNKMTYIKVFAILLVVDLARIKVSKRDVM